MPFMFVYIKKKLHRPTLPQWQIPTKLCSLVCFGVAPFGTVFQAIALMLKQNMYSKKGWWRLRKFPRSLITVKNKLVKNMTPYILIPFLEGHYPAGFCVIPGGPLNLGSDCFLAESNYRPGGIENPARSRSVRSGIGYPSGLKPPHQEDSRNLFSKTLKSPPAYSPYVMMRRSLINSSFLEWSYRSDGKLLALGLNSSIKIQICLFSGG